MSPEVDTVGELALSIFDSGEGFEFTRIKDGETNRNYKVEQGGRSFVLRVPGEAAEVDRSVEAANIGALLSNPQTAAIIPHYRVYVHNGENVVDPGSKMSLRDGIAVTEFIEGQDLNTSLLRDRSIQRSLVETLHTFHTSGVRFVNSYDPVEDEVRKYKSIVFKNPSAPDLVSSQTLELVERAERELDLQLPADSPVSTHNDLIYGNLRLGKDGRVHLIDFEYSGFNNRGLVYDFGTLLGENLFSDDPMDSSIMGDILELASQRYGQAFNIERVYDAARVNVLVTFWWGLVEYANASSDTEKAYFAEYVNKRKDLLANGIFS